MSEVAVAAVEEETPVSETTAEEPVEAAEAPSSPDAGGSEGAEAQPPADELQPEQPAPAEPEAEQASPPGEAPTTDIRTPFAFRVDRSEVQVPGAYVDHWGYVRIPKDQWDRVVQPRVADRGVIQREFQRRDQEIAHWRQQADPERNPAVQEARMIADALFGRLFSEDLTEDDVLDEVARIRGELPVLKERARAQAAEARLTEYDASSQQEQYAEAYRQSVPVLEGSLRDYVSEAVRHPSIAGAGLDPEEFIAALWREGSPSDLEEIFEDAEGPGHLCFETPAGWVRVRNSRIDPLLMAAARTAQRERETRDKLLADERKKTEAATRAAQVAKENAAALAPRTSAPPVVGAQGAPGGVQQEKEYERLRREAKEAQNAGDYGKAAELREQASAAYDRHMTGAR